MPDWRADTGWGLVSYELAAFERPPERPTATAELANGGEFASEYRDGRIVATWYRSLPLSASVKGDLAKRRERADARRTPPRKVG